MVLLGFRKLSGSNKQQTTSKWPWLFWIHVWLWDMLWSSQSNHWAGHCRLPHKIHFLSQVTILSRNGSLLLCRIERICFKMMIFLIFSQPMKHPLIKLYHLSNFLQMPNDRMVEVEFFGNVSRGRKRISFDDCFPLVIVSFNSRPLCSSSSRLSSPLQNFLTHHCTVPSLTVPGPNVSLMLQTLCCFTTHFELE